MTYHSCLRMHFITEHVPSISMGAGFYLHIMSHYYLLPNFRVFSCLQNIKIRVPHIFIRSKNCLSILDYFSCLPQCVSPDFSSLSSQPRRRRCSSGLDDTRESPSYRVALYRPKSASRVSSSLVTQQNQSIRVTAPGVRTDSNHAQQSTQDAMSTTAIPAAVSSIVTNCRVWARLVCLLEGQSIIRNCYRMDGWKRKRTNGILICAGSVRTDH